MTPTALFAISLAFTPMVDRCRSVVARLETLPSAEAPALFCKVVDIAEAEVFDANAFRLTAAALPDGADGRLSAHAATSAGLTTGIPPDARMAVVRQLASCPPPSAGRRPEFSCNIPPVRTALSRGPSIRIPDPRSLSSNEQARIVAKLIYTSLSDGSVNGRAAKWRLPLVRMLVDAAPGTDFDRVYAFLLRTFGGSDEQARIRALAKWAGERLPSRDAADVYRAETRYWLNLGDSAMTVDAVRRMERARPDYAVRARRLSALCHATSGELDKAKAEIARSRRECNPSSGERLELLYLEAWIWLQEGDAAAAGRNLRAIVAESPRSASARKALAVLESISNEGE